MSALQELKTGARVIGQSRSDGQRNGISQPMTSILLVDDNPGNLLAYRTILSELNLPVLCASSGEEALRYLLDKDFALVILDVRMPGMDGFEVAEMMRQRDRSRNTPILFLSAEETDKAALQRAFDLGAIDYLVKPISSELLRSNVAKILGFS
jgi:CheY-like chemotaxis protein